MWTGTGNNNSRHALSTLTALQLAAVAGLREVALHACEHVADGFGTLSSLSALTSLTQTLCSHLPAHLSLLVPLKRLHIRRSGSGGTAEEAAIAVDGISKLTQLTSLTLGYLPLPGPPDSLKGLSELQSFTWRSEEVASRGFPFGRWLGNLHSLQSSASQVLHSSIILGAAALEDGPA